MEGVMPAIYIIEAVDARILKIGFTGGDPYDRMKTLQHSSPFRLRLVHTELLDDDIDVRRFEKHVHGLLHQYRMRGEWFSVSVDDAKKAIVTAYENRMCKPMSQIQKFPAYKTMKKPTRYIS
jgi:hypothetical protein